MYHINRRLLECKNINTIVLATSADHSDDPLQEVANKLGINLFREVLMMFLIDTIRPQLSMSWIL